MSIPFRPGPFTASQLAVITLSAQGLNTDEIAAKLDVTRAMVMSHFTRARRRTGMRDRAGLVHVAWCHGQLGDRPDLLATIARLRQERDTLRAQLLGGRLLRSARPEAA